MRLAKGFRAALLASGFVAVFSAAAVSQDDPVNPFYAVMDAAKRNATVVDAKSGQEVQAALWSNLNKKPDCIESGWYASESLSEFFECATGKTYFAESVSASDNRLRLTAKPRPDDPGPMEKIE